jgi:hypothetical protein
VVAGICHIDFFNHPLPFLVLWALTTAVSLDMPIVVAVDGDRKGIVQQRPPAKDGDVDLTLQGAGKRGKSGAL